NPGPLRPERRIIPLYHKAVLDEDSGVEARSCCISSAGILFVSGFTFFKQELRLVSSCTHDTRDEQRDQCEGLC
ncbi:MAG: hypothetical protein P4L69_01260, partial [Desulfosporosinus sp.]|nr:hypothetical protein [Desulfosporosinus sp.]